MKKMRLFFKALFHHVKDGLAILDRFITAHWAKALFASFFVVVVASIGLLTAQMVLPHRALDLLGVTQVMAIPPDEPVEDGSLKAHIVWITRLSDDAISVGDYLAVQDTTNDQFFWIEEVVSFDSATGRLMTSYDGVIAHVTNVNRVIGHYMRRSLTIESLAYFSTQPVGFAFITLFLMLSLYTAHRGLITPRG